MSDPTLEDFKHYFRVGRLGAWRKFTMIQNRLNLQRTLDKCIEELEAALGHSQQGQDQFAAQRRDIQTRSPIILPISQKNSSPPAVRLANRSRGRSQHRQSDEKTNGPNIQDADSLLSPIEDQVKHQISQPFQSSFQIPIRTRMTRSQSRKRNRT